MGDALETAGTASNLKSECQTKLSFEDNNFYNWSYATMNLFSTWMGDLCIRIGLAVAAHLLIFLPIYTEKNNYFFIFVKYILYYYQYSFKKWSTSHSSKKICQMWNCQLHSSRNRVLALSCACPKGKRSKKDWAQQLTQGQSTYECRKQCL